MGHDELIGMVLGERYRLRKLIGVGTIGMVYVADHTTLRRRSAIKILRREFLSDPDIVERFRREARAISRLDHRNIVRIEGFGRTDDGRLYLVMEYIRGPSLRDLLRKPDPPALARSLSILKQLCDAVAFANRQEIIHRDLKPENLLLMPRRGRREKDLVKVLDFGMAKIRGSDSRTVTREGEVFGTPAYMAPEQCYGSPADTFTDQYTVGVIAYELIAGRLPFKAKSSIDFMVHHAQTEPEPPSTHRTDIRVPPGLDEIVLRSLAKKPEERWPSLNAFGQALSGEMEQLNRISGIRTSAVGADTAHTLAPPSGPLELDPNMSVMEAARACLTSEIIELHPSELASRGSGWLTDRYCQVVRLIAEQMRQLDLISSRLKSLLADAVAAEEASLRAETELAILEAEANEIDLRFEQQLSEIHAQLVELAERRAEARGPKRKALDRRMHELEKRRSELEDEQQQELARLEPQMDQHLEVIAERQQTMHRRHVALGDALDRRRRRGVDFQLDEYYEMLDRILSAQRNASDPPEA